MQSRLSYAGSQSSDSSLSLATILKARDKFKKKSKSFHMKRRNAAGYKINDPEIKRQVDKYLGPEEEYRVREVYSMLESPYEENRMSLWKLRTAFRELNLRLPPEDELLRITEEDIDDGDTGFIDLTKLFVYLVRQKSKDRPTHDGETVSAFKALGGREDKTGTIEAQQLEDVIVNFGFSIDIQALIREIDDDESGTIDYDEFFNLLYSGEGE